MKMQKKYLAIPLFFVLVLSLFSIFSLPQNKNTLNSDDFSNSITYHSNVCKQITRADGTIESPECSHNLLYDSGKELIEAYLGDTGGATDEVDQISLCDASVGCQTPVAGASETFNAITDRGLEEATGTYSSVGGNGNWTISHTFTATGSVSTNVTRLQNTAGTNFAGNNFTLANLENQDQITISWNIFVE
jgi:hypothetical protein